MSHDPMPSSENGEILLLATEDNVHAFELKPPLRVSIGRHDANDLQLASRTVSNFHAEIVLEEGAILLRDLGSTNGTYVNDQAVTQTPLNAGDHLRIGNHLLTVHVERTHGRRERFFRYRRHSELFGVGAKGRILSMRGHSRAALRTLRVMDPRDLSLPDLLRILTTNARSVLLCLQKENDVGHIFIRKDKIVHASYRKATGEKALYRFFGWQRASYEIKELPGSPPVPHTIRIPTDALIIEGMRQIEELGQLITQLPPLEAPLLLKEDCSLPVKAHSPAEIEIYKAIIRYETIAAVLENTSMTDCRALRLIHALLRKGVFRISEASNTTFEDTFVYRPNKP